MSGRSATLAGTGWCCTSSAALGMVRPVGAAIGLVVVRVSIWTEPSPSDFDRWEALIVDGGEPVTAARSLGHTWSAFKRANEKRHAGIITTSREIRAGSVDERMEKWAVADTAPPAIRLAWARRWNRAYADKLELTGADGGEVAVTVEDARDKLARKIAALAAGTVTGASSDEPDAG